MVLIAKQGFITRLYASCNNGVVPGIGNFEDNAECYTMQTLLGERTGDEHGDIIVVAGKHCIEKTSTNRFVVWFMCSDDAEPYNSYDNCAEAMDAVMEIEELSFSQS